MNAKDEKLWGWSERVAGLSVDALVDAGIVSKEDFDSAIDIVREEIYIRLIIDDTPEKFEENPI
ncbi:MAG TPA: hypothetical protein PKA82_08615 [Pyrinomonadaceae bacterium]|nr:hypothetical protein [Pyrinomonadaceae bacterium]